MKATLTGSLAFVVMSIALIKARSMKSMQPEEEEDEKDTFDYYLEGSFDDLDLLDESIATEEELLNTSETSESQLNKSYSTFSLGLNRSDSIKDHLAELGPMCTEGQIFLYIAKISFYACLGYSVFFYVRLNKDKDR